MSKDKSKREALIVEDEPEVVFMVRSCLKKLDFQTAHASSVTSAEHKLASFHFDLIVLDRVLPDGDGIELLPIIHDTARETQILMLTQKNEVEARVSGLTRGADDYMGKPFNSRELAARVQALLRRSHIVSNNVVKINGFSLDVLTNKAQYNEHTALLTELEFELLYLFLRNSSHRCSRKMIERLWSIDNIPTPSGINVLVKRLRKRLLQFPIQIVTRYGAGYELIIGS